MNRRLQFAVIGLGRFGSRVAEGLYQQGHDVIAVDVSREAVEENSDRVTAAICGDATRPDVLASIGASEMDTVIVAIGDDIDRQRVGGSAGGRRTGPLVAVGPPARRHNLHVAGVDPPGCVEVQAGLIQPVAAG